MIAIASTPQKLNPPLKWAGGKTWLASKLAEMYEPYRKTHEWVEPFVGAGGALLGVNPDRAIVGDLNPYLINVWEWLQKGAIRRLATPVNEDQYYKLRTSFNAAEEYSAVTAEQFMLLCRLAFNGLCRFNGKGGFNTPAGKKSNGEFQTLPVNFDAELSRYEAVLKGCQFYCLDYKELLSKVQFNGIDSFVYADPPYDTEKGFVSYYGRFEWQQQVELAQTLAAYAKDTGSPIVASNANTDRIIELYQGLGFNLSFVEGRNDSINCKADKRGSKTEMLATLNLPAINAAGGAV